MSINSFLNPLEELVHDSSDDLTEQIAQQFDAPGEESDAEDVVPRISHQQALAALNQLRLYEMQQSQGLYHLITTLDEHEGVVKDRRIVAVSQASITQYLRPITALDNAQLALPEI